MEDKEQEPAARILVPRPVKRYEPEFLQRFCLFFIFFSKDLRAVPHITALRNVQVPISPFCKELPLRDSVPAAGRGVSEHIHRTNRTLLRIGQHLGLFAYGLAHRCIFMYTEFKSLQRARRCWSSLVINFIRTLCMPPQSLWFRKSCICLMIRQVNLHSS